MHEAESLGFMHPVPSVQRLPRLPSRLMNAVPKVLLIIDFSEGYGRGLLRGITKYSQLFGPWSFSRMPPLYREAGGIDAVIKWAQDWGADGIIGQMQSAEDAQRLAQTGIPIIAQDVIERFKNIPNITGLYRETGRMAAEHFLQRGFTKFAFYGFNDIVWSRERLEGFEQRISEAGHSALVYEHPSNEKPELWSYKASPLVKWLLGLPKPLALMACDDNQSMHVLEACKIAGISVPEQIAILGVDNDEVVCNLSEPPLSSISLNTEKAGYEAAQLLEKMMRGASKEMHDIIAEPLHIVVRRSSDIFAIEDKELAKALRFIYYHFREPIHVESVVSATALSRRVLEKRFAAVLGKSILNAINDLRTEQVALMLTSTNMPIGEIASACGYTDEKNLARFFKLKKKETPLSYRKNRMGGRI